MSYLYRSSVLVVLLSCHGNMFLEAGNQFASVQYATKQTVLKCAHVAHACALRKLLMTSCVVLRCVGSSEECNWRGDSFPHNRGESVHCEALFLVIWSGSFSCFSNFPNLTARDDYIGVWLNNTFSSPMTSLEVTPNYGNK